MTPESENPQIRILECHDSDVHFVTMTPDDQRIISGSKDGTVKVWDFESGTLLHTLQCPTTESMKALISPDGKRLILLCNNDSTATLWNLENAVKIFGIDDLDSFIASSDNLLLFISRSSSETITIYTLWDGELFAQGDDIWLLVDPHHLTPLAFVRTIDNTIQLLTNDNNVTQTSINFSSWSERLHQFSGLHDPTQLAGTDYAILNYNDYVDIDDLTDDHSDLVLLSDLDTKSLILAHWLGPFDSVSFRYPQRRMIIKRCDDDGVDELIVYDMESGDTLLYMEKISGYNQNIRGFSPDGRFLCLDFTENWVGFYDFPNWSIIVDLKTSEILSLLQETHLEAQDKLVVLHKGLPCFVDSISPQSDLPLATDSSKGSHASNLLTIVPRKGLYFYSHDLSWGGLFNSCISATVYQEIDWLMSPDITTVDFSRDKTLLVMGTTSGEVLIRDWKTGEIHLTFNLPEPVVAVAISNDNNIAAAGTTDGQLVTYSLNTSNIVFEVIATNNPLNYLAFSKDSTVLVSVFKDSTIRTFDMESGKETFEKETSRAIQLVNSNRISIVECDHLKHKGTFHYWDREKPFGEDCFQKLFFYKNLLIWSSQYLDTLAVQDLDNSHLVHFLTKDFDRIDTEDLSEHTLMRFEELNRICFKNGGMYKIEGRHDGTIHISLM